MFERFAVVKPASAPPPLFRYISGVTLPSTWAPLYVTSPVTLPFDAIDKASLNSVDKAVSNPAKFFASPEYISFISTLICMLPLSSVEYFHSLPSVSISIIGLFAQYAYGLVL